MKLLWADEGIRSTYVQRSCFQLIDSAEYYFSRLDELCRPDYEPTYQDMLRSRVRTFGIVEGEFKIDPYIFKLCDVGGQRSQRKKWIQCFAGVTAVLFVAAISEYDQVLHEDAKCNRVVEALSIFDEISNSKWFVQTAIVLFLNKRDLLADKLKTVPLSRHFPDFKGESSEQAASTYFKDMFESKCKERPIYTHVTCATDTQNVKFVFNAVQAIVVRAAMRDAGLTEY